MCRQIFTVMISLQENRRKVNDINNIQPRRAFVAPVTQSFQHYEPKFKAFGLAAKRASDGAKIGHRLRGAAIEANEIESLIDSDLMIALS